MAPMVSQGYSHREAPGNDPHGCFASTYDLWGRKLLQTDWYRDRSYVELIKALLGLQGKERILDVGCGDGSLLAELGHSGGSAVGVDASLGMVNLAQVTCRDVSNSKILHGRFEDIAPALGSFDLIICKNILHLVPDLSRFFGAIRGILRGRGRLLVAETVSPSLEANTFVRELFKKAGLESLKVHYFRQGDIHKLLQTECFDITKQAFYPQEIILSKWLAAKGASAHAKLRCHELADRATPEVKSAMRINLISDRRTVDWRLLRLQFLASCQLRSIA